MITKLRNTYHKTFFKSENFTIFQHQSKCNGLAEQSIVTSPLIESISEEIKQKKKECSNCGNLFSTAGGIYTKHIKSCQMISQSVSMSVAEEKTGIKYCPKCNKQYLPHVKRFFDAHVRSCRGENLSQTLPIPSNIGKTV